MKKLFLLLTLVLLSSFASADVKLPGESPKLLPQLVEETLIYWPDIPDYVFPAGLIDQESNWKPTATLKTSRELGCGLGQFTLATDVKGNVRFDALAETKKLSKDLAEWNWRDCQAVRFQMRAVILKNKAQHRSCALLMADATNALKCDGAAYNGGAGSVAKRQRLCRAQADCNPKIWDRNLDTQCPQATVKVAGYGESFCEINSRYPGRIYARMPKFRATMDKLWAEKHK